MTHRTILFRHVTVMTVILTALAYQRDSYIITGSSSANKTTTFSFIMLTENV